MKPVKQLDVKPGMSVKELVEEMSKSGVFGAGRIAQAEEILKDLLPTKDVEPNITMRQIQEAVAKHFHIDFKDMQSKKRTDAIAFPRQIALYLSRSLTEYSLPEIGAAFGGRDHTTVMYACEKLTKELHPDTHQKDKS